MLRPPPLDEAERWMAHPPGAPEPTDVIRAFIAASRAAFDQEETARFAQVAETQLNQSRFLTGVAEAELRDAHIERAMLIAREALPRDMRNADRPIWNGAFELIAQARARDRATAVAIGHTSTVMSVGFSPDGRRVSPPPATIRRGCGMPRVALRGPYSRAMRTLFRAPRSAPTGSGWLPPPQIVRRGCGMPQVALRSPHSRAIRARSTAPSSAPTARGSLPPPMIARRGCGMR